MVIIPADGAVGVGRAAAERGIAASPGPDAVHRIAPADHAGRRDDHVVDRAPDPSATPPADLERIVVARLPGGDVGVLGDHDDRLGQAVGTCRG